jgi:hypothetical protein
MYRSTYLILEGFKKIYLSPDAIPFKDPSITRADIASSWEHRLLVLQAISIQLSHRSSFTEYKFWVLHYAMRREIRFNTQFSDLSHEIIHLNSHIYFDKKKFSRLKSEITSF